MFANQFYDEDKSDNEANTIDSKAKISFKY